MPLSYLSPTDTIEGSPIATNGAPSGATPTGCFASPTLTLGPSRLWAYAVDGNFANGGFALKLWYYDPDNQVWAVFSEQLALTVQKQLGFFSYDFAPAAKLYLEVVVNNPGSTKVAFGFGIGLAGV